MATDAEILEAATDALVEGLGRPARLRSREGEEIQERSTKESLDAISYLAGQASAASGGFGFVFKQFIPPGGGGTP